MILHFTGLRRSGNHAVIRWAINHLPGAVHWRNNYLCPHWPSEHWYVNGELSGPLPRVDHLVFSAEDVPYECGWLILRDVYNTAASRIVMGQRIPGLPLDERFASLWLENAGCAGAILFNRWVTSPEYRAEVLRSFTSERERPLAIIPNEHGVGSAFTDSTAAADLGDLLRRYERAPLPQWLLDRDDLREANRRIFGWSLDRNGQRN